MTITRAQLEAELTSRREAMLTAVGIVSADLNSPIGYAVRQCGGTIANLSAVADADLATVDPADYDKLMDLAEYRLLLNIKGHWARVDITSGPFSQSFNQFAEQVNDDIAAMKTQLETQYSFGGVSSIEVGVIDFDFQQTDPETDL